MEKPKKDEFTPFVEEQRDGVLNHFRGLCYNDAEDLTQKTFIQLYPQFYFISRDGRKQYMWKVTTTVWIDYQRKTRRQKDHHEEFLRQYSILPYFENENALDGDERIARLHQAILRLSPQEQKLIVLYYFENLSLRAIAAICGVSISAISRQHTHILKKLQKDLGDDNILPAKNNI